MEINDLWREFENRFAEVQAEKNALKMIELFREYREKGLDLDGVEMAWFTSPLTPLQRRGEQQIKVLELINQCLDEELVGSSRLMKIYLELDKMLNEKWGRR